ncbi:MAG: response regulator transcription factor [Magnetococcales bacterium]|nr:response regulator transcription factor [Magnetococcales bacterium]
MRILVVEDDRELSRQVADLFRDAEYIVDVARDGEEGEYLGLEEAYDAVVLDLGLPRIDGLSILRRWRRDGRVMPVLILSARNTWRDKVSGLREGADDYLSKPFELEELLVRIEALIRRSAGHAEAEIRCGDLVWNSRDGILTLNGKRIHLTPTEARMGRYLIHHAGRILSKGELTEHIYGTDHDPDSNTLEVMINRLRQKLGRNRIETLRGRGYRLVDPKQNDAVT